MLFLAQNPAKKPDGNSNDNQSPPNATCPLPVTVNCNQSTGAVTDTEERETPEGDASIQWSNWVLVFIGGITAWAVWYQARKTAEATKTMEDALPLQKSAADATLLNAQAVISSERAWVMVNLRFQPGHSIALMSRPEAPQRGFVWKYPPLF